MQYTYRAASQVVLVIKNLPANTEDIRDVGSVPGSGRSSGGGHGNPLHYSWLENPIDRGAWQATVHSFAKSWTQLKWLNNHTGIHTKMCLYHMQSNFLTEHTCTQYSDQKTEHSSTTEAFLMLSLPIETSILILSKITFMYFCTLYISGIILHAFFLSGSLLLNIMFVKFTYTVHFHCCMVLHVLLSNSAWTSGLYIFHIWTILVLLEHPRICLLVTICTHLCHRHNRSEIPGPQRQVSKALLPIYIPVSRVWEIYLLLNLVKLCFFYFL